jgi:molybdenum cofactor biosynthesis protein B
MGFKEHKEKSLKKVSCVVITISDTRNEKSDKSGNIIKNFLKNESHEIVDYKIIKDEPRDIKEYLEKIINIKNIQAIILNGGTGISKRDRTYEVVKSLLEKRIDGFGEIFRYLSFKEIGTPAIMSRSIAGICNGKVIISIPGSENAVRLAMEKLILPELGHMVWEANR